MIKKLRSITGKLSAAAAVAVILLVWQALSSAGVVPRFMLPSPVDVVRAFVGDFGVLMVHSATTLQEAFLGLAIGVALAFCAAVAMDRVPFLYKALYPVLVITQTIPTVAIAPLLVLWLGYDMAPKVTLVVIVCFFPIAVNLLDGFRSADPDTLTLLRSMGAGKGQLFRFAKLPAALGHFFAGLRVSVSYSVVGAVIAEWLGGRAGLGVYMTQVRKSYAYDKMFAVIFLVSLISLLLMKGVTLLRNACMPWERAQKRDAG